VGVVSGVPEGGAADGGVLDGAPLGGADVVGAEAGHHLGFELCERPLVAGALVQDRAPRQPGLRAFEHEELEQHAGIPLRHTPHVVVVLGHGLAAERPGAPDAAVLEPLGHSGL